MRNEEPPPLRVPPSAGSSSASSPEAWVVASTSSYSSSIASIGRQRRSEGGAGHGEANLGLTVGDEEGDTAMAHGRVVVDSEIPATQERSS